VIVEVAKAILTERQYHLAVLGFGTGWAAVFFFCVLMLDYTPEFGLLFWMFWGLLLLLWVVEKTIVVAKKRRLREN